MSRSPVTSSTIRHTRRRLGAYYTSPEVAALIARHALAPVAQGEPVILDPACGDGQLLAAAWRKLQEVAAPPTAAARIDLAFSCLFGVDVDPAATATARRNLAEAVLLGVGNEDQIRRLCEQFARNIVVNNLLLDESTETDAFGSHAPKRFDAVLMNPPFLNRRQQAKQFDVETLDFWPKRFRTARGAYDVFVLFVERALELLRDGGQCGAITPNKIAAMNYAKPCRELLERHAKLQWVIDASHVPLFGRVDVYPVLFGFEKSVDSHDPDSPSVAVQTLIDASDLLGPALDPWEDSSQTTPWEFVSARRFSGTQWRMAGDFEVESRVPTVDAKDVADWHVGTPGFGAQRVSKLLGEDSGSNPGRIPFIVSGNIHRFRINNDPMRFMKQRWSRPVLDPLHPKLTARQQELFAQPKLVVAGMGQRLRVAWDDVGRALGVQVYAATNLRVPRHYLLALLNSNLMTRLFRQRCAGKRMSDDYLAVHKAQLQLLPIRIFDDACPLQQEIVQLAIERSAIDGSHPQCDRLEAAIDSLVLKLYDVDEQEFVEGR